MKLGGKEISKLIKESFKDDPNSWVRPDLSLDTERENKELGVRISNEYGLIYISNKKRGYKRNYVKLSLIRSKLLYISYVRRIIEIPIPLIILFESLALLMVFPKLYQLYKFHDHNLLVDATKVVNFNSSKSYTREKRLEKLLG
ncbi:MAG: hypothetical protein SLAVMIC_00023 [uncultured marine phage]|uniref:Uncharacterized protein n=1 Tax=uncultured marine phage TaxID=707152 RepID=A0A8D9FQQ9_9VIRU|nr:MAG: hypothetical protein SLAVMIC_00023 [uncultured marine phage]